MGQGIKLDAYLRERGPIPPGKAGRIAVEVLNQLQARLLSGATRALSGIGPGRILISADGRVMLLDPEDELPAVVSAPAYASPEEIRGAAPDSRSSVYSVGCFLFELLTGQPPYTGLDTRQVLEGHLSRPAPEVRALRAEIPASLSAAVASFLAKDPAGRPQDPAQAVQLLRSALARPAGAAGAGAAPAAPAPRPAVPVNQFGSSVPKSANRPGPGMAPRAAGPSRNALPARSLPGGLPGGRAGSPRAGSAPGGIPARPLGAGHPPRPGGAVGRGRLGRPAEAESDSKAPAPAARSPWIFTWFGLALGIVLCLILVAFQARKAAEPTAIELSPVEKEQSLDRRKAFRRSLDDDNSVASAELEKLPSMRLSMNDRAEHISKVLDQYPHVAVAPRIAEAISKLHATVEEQAAENAGSSPPEEASPDSASSAPPAPPPPAEKSEEEKKEESPDDIGAKAGPDDGKGDL